MPRPEDRADRLAAVPGSAGPIEIRGARPADAAEMARLACELGYPTSAEAMADCLAALLPDPGQHVAVVPDGDRLLGWIHVQHGLTLDIGARAEIVGLVVDATARRLGLGRRLVAVAEAWTRAQGLPSLMVRSNVARDVSHPFYESIGFTRIKTQHVYAKRLDR
jgi:GNAT superfamily N-acetyltransferase